MRDANAKLQRLASLDGLTRIANRGAFNRQLEAGWQDHAQRRAPLSVLLCDLDEFKVYKDNYGHYGHLAGDEALTKVAGALSSVLRSGDDIAARYGGEEFAVLLADCDARQAAAIAHRVLEAVRTLHIHHCAPPQPPM